jgi:SNF2 family DNA or RNA helicase
MSFIGTLRPYQVSVVDRMVDQKKVLLAADQGTGKTPSTICAIEGMFDDETITEPGLIICLSTLKDQWAASIEKFTGGSSTSLVIPGGESSKAIRKKAYQQAADWDADYIILHFEQVVNDYEYVRQLPRGFVVVDEASFIRGFNSGRSKAVKALAKHTPVKYGLTGTPIENGRPEEFFSIMEFIDPTVFGRHDLFDRSFIVRNSYGQVSRYRNIPEFHSMLGKAMIRLRADDPEVAPYMPETDDKDPILVPLDRSARKLYDKVAKELLKDLDQTASWGSGFNLAANYGKGAADSSRDVLAGRIGQKMLTLQMLCDHPDLLRISAERFVKTEGAHGSGYIAALAAAGELDALKSTPKLNHTLKWIKERLDSNELNKVVLFTRYVDMAEILASSLIGKQCSLYTGRLNRKVKTENLTRFQTDPECRVLVATDAGGFGLDIPQANYLINYDLPDGAGLADQRDTRIVRTSSQFKTVSRNWIQIKGSLEEYKMDRLSQKRAVRDAFVDVRGLNDRGGVTLTADSLASFLRKHSV